MKALILATGRCRDKHMLSLESEYIKRLQPFMATRIVELPHGKSKDAPTLKAEESKHQLAKIPPQSKVIALDERGTALTTLCLAKKLESYKDSGVQDVVFIIGGSDGLHQNVKDQADITLSLSQLTFPHQMVRPILAEQIYRAMTVIAGHPYHRE